MDVGRGEGNTVWGLVRQSIRPLWCLPSPNPHPSSLSLLPVSYLEDIHRLFNEPWTQIVISKTMLYCKIIRRHRKYELGICIKFWRHRNTRNAKKKCTLKTVNVIFCLLEESKCDMRNMFEKCGKSTRQNERKSEDEKTFSQESHLISPGRAQHTVSRTYARWASPWSFNVYLITAMVINIT